MSSPKFPQSNGLAESCVKAMKNLIIKNRASGKLDWNACQKGIIEFRNTPRANGLTPAEVVFGREMRTSIPRKKAAYKPQWIGLIDKLDKGAVHEANVKADGYYNLHARDLKPLKKGQQVFIQDDHGRWTKTGIVLFSLRARTYRVKLPSGRTLVRNRLFLRPNNVPEAQMSQDLL